MSPRVQLALYPDGDHAFTTATSISLNIVIPDEYSASEVIAAVERHLRETYPSAAIRSEVAADESFDALWHVYRDGVPKAREGA